MWMDRGDWKVRASSELKKARSGERRRLSARIPAPASSGRSLWRERFGTTRSRRGRGSRRAARDAQPGSSGSAWSEGSASGSVEPDCLRCWRWGWDWCSCKGGRVASGLTTNMPSDTKATQDTEHEQSSDYRNDTMGKDFQTLVIWSHAPGSKKPAGARHQKINQKHWLFDFKCKIFNYIGIIQHS